VKEEGKLLEAEQQDLDKHFLDYLGCLEVQSLPVLLVLQTIVPD
jgi:hypothetical protein